MSDCLENKESTKWRNFIDRFIFHCEKCDESIDTNDGNSSSLSKHLIRLAVCNGYPMELFFYCFVGKTFNKKSFPINYQHCTFMASSSLSRIVYGNYEPLIYWDMDDANIRQRLPQTLPEMVNITERLLKCPRSLWSCPDESKAIFRSNCKYYLDSIDLECLCICESNTESCRFQLVTATNSNSESEKSQSFIKRKTSKVPCVPEISAQTNSTKLPIIKPSLPKLLKSRTIPYDPKNYAQLIGSKRPQSLLNRTNVAENDKKNLHTASSTSVYMTILQTAMDQVFSTFCNDPSKLRRLIPTTTQIDSNNSMANEIIISTSDGQQQQQQQSNTNR
ncbi:uncharacterized protein LOC124492174 [Dermatophagoides farinae]|uniref:uncharacterized protein LOC124492174 n=1 Tax=Dermatophagoides farinae TaxID=6954 RepID=UPI003F6167BE